MSDDESTRIAGLLHEAGDTHHAVYRIVDGDDPYAERISQLLRAAAE